MSAEGDTLHKFVTIPFLFNTENLLEFSIEPDKRCIILQESYLKFHVEIPESFLPDNNFGNKVIS